MCAMLLVWMAFLQGSHLLIGPAINAQTAVSGETTHKSAASTIGVETRPVESTVSLELALKTGATSSSRVVLTSIDHHLYLVSIQMLKTHLCAGTLYKPDWVITAAHCLVFESRNVYKYPVEMMPVSHILVVAGATDVFSSDATLAISALAIFPHPRFSTVDYTHDIGLIQVSTPFPLSVVRLTRLPTAVTLDLFSSKDCKVVGWGFAKVLKDVGMQTDTQDTTSRSQKQIKHKVYLDSKKRRRAHFLREFVKSLNVPQVMDYSDYLATKRYYTAGKTLSELLTQLMPIKQCKELSGPHVIQRDMHLCTGEVDKEREACQNDPGSPLLCRAPGTSGGEWYQLGVASRDIGCTPTRRPAVYIRLDCYLNWLRRTYIREISSESYLEQHMEVRAGSAPNALSLLAAVLTLVAGYR